MINVYSLLPPVLCLPRRFFPRMRQRLLDRLQHVRCELLSAYIHTRRATTATRNSGTLTTRASVRACDVGQRSVWAEPPVRTPVHPGRIGGSNRGPDSDGY
jgi:hypothetical protein